MAAVTRPRDPLPVRDPGDVGIDDVLSRLQENDRACDEAWLRRAYEYAERSHRGQVRRSGDPYISHPLGVAHMLAELKFDQTSVAVGLLHDVLEDTGATKKDLAAEFGDEIADLVDGVSKIGRHEYVRSDEVQAESFRKLILASARDLRVIVVKLVDRLHNMLTLEHLEPGKQRRISRETLEIYAPLAHRLGMSRIQRVLEDRAFRHLHPHRYEDIRKQLDERIKGARSTTRRVAERLRQVLEGAEIEAEISHRVKGYYSIYQKLRRRQIDLPDLFDFVAFRIITVDVKNTYAALGVVHQIWRPIPGRFKDYIAMPKPNLYQSLHTTVLGRGGQPFEVQIRTQAMDLLAEEGVAAHWRYKGGQLDTDQKDVSIVWLRQLLEWQQEVPDPRTFLSALKIDLYPDEVYVFTPKGDVLSLPRGASPLDFAYRVHTELGHHTSGARVNGRLVPLRTELNNGDIVEIKTNPNREPSRDWLNIVATPRARSKIRHWINAEQKKRAIEIGRTMLTSELRRYRVSPRRMFDSKEMADFLAAEGYGSVDELCSRLGFGPRFGQAGAACAPAAGASASPGPGTEPPAPGREQGVAPRPGEAGGQGRERHARVLRRLLQPVAGRGHHGFRDPRPGRLRPLGGLSERAQPAVPPRTGDPGRVGRAGTTRCSRSPWSSRPATGRACSRASPRRSPSRAATSATSRAAAAVTARRRSTSWSTSGTGST